MANTVSEMNRTLEQADCLYSRADVDAALDRIASDLGAAVATANPVILCIMNGGLVIAGQLLPRLTFPLQLDYAHVSRYRETTTGGALEWVVRPQSDLTGRTVVVVDDILDEGTTLAALVEACKAEGAERVLTLALIHKHHDRKSHPGFRADFTGLETEDRYLFGYGMDYKGYWRNAPGIYAVKGL
ncbi:hypoxanthine phosphoribosyltransferase [Halospina denitrificans]|uniref:Hypoxanthine phosphoribosyltransferase n=1 Tax=Halospina denitrificans TaxID=332522 RepID=A0A4R7JQ75_9GAMM|nr:hypoxanthine-guanine phosphoribosyltransferase [Halospina denitrificans]TDT40332.1 hypoxanthine phosphoribosyltransferase [Halospina denitrificans]